MSNVVSLHHIVFCTKYRWRTIPMEFRIELYRYIYSVTSEKNCKLLRIGGMEEHVHLLVDLNPTIALAYLVRDIKALSSAFLKKNPHFGDFGSWAPGYYACSLSPDSKNSVIEYIKNQEAHHRRVDLEMELLNLHHYADIAYEEGDLM